MAFDTNDLNYPAAIDQSLEKYLNGFLHSGPNFGPAQNMFSRAVSQPSFMPGPGGGFIDPMDIRNIYGGNYLNERGDIAQQNLQDKNQAAGLLTNAGSGIANFKNSMLGLNAGVLGGSGLGAFSSLF